LLVLLDLFVEMAKGVAFGLKFVGGAVVAISSWLLISRK